MLRINSADRHSGTPESFTCSLRTPIQGRYELQAALIPHTAPPVSSVRNGSIVVNYSGENNDTTHTIAAGEYYDQASLLTALKAALDVSGYTHTLTVDSTTQRLTIKLVTTSNNVGSQIVYYSARDRPASTLSGVLGLHETVTLIGATGSGNSQTLAAPISLAYPLCYNIRVDGAFSAEDTEGRPATFMIPITANNFSVINHTNNQSFSQRVHFPKPTRSVRVELLDDRGLPITGASDYTIILRKIA